MTTATIPHPILDTAIALLAPSSPLVDVNMRSGYVNIRKQRPNSEEVAMNIPCQPTNDPVPKHTHSPRVYALVQRIVRLRAAHRTARSDVRTARSRVALRLVGGLAIAVAIATASSVAVSAQAAPAPSQISTDRRYPGDHRGVTADFRGVNWADPRDNYAADEVVPSGLDPRDDYRTTYRRSRQILRQFDRRLGANTVRLPINPASVGTQWWSSYQAAIDAATDLNYKVILGYWEAENAKDGRLDDASAFNAMWDTVVHRYQSNPRVYFEPMNEPFGYTLDEWVSVTSRWLSRHRQLPRHRVVISGTGYNDNVTGVGAAKELDGTLLSLHFYGYWDDDTDEDGWKANLAPRIGSFGWRTIIDEAGGPMTTGLNYSNHTGNVYTSYFGAVTETARNQKMGIVYWPGLRTGDAYSLTTLDEDRRLVINNASGLAQLRWGWGLRKKELLNDQPPAPPGEVLRGVASNRCIDVPGFSTSPGTALDLWDCNGGGNQTWDWTTSRELRIYANKCLAIEGSGAAEDPAVIADCNGTVTQRWRLNDDLSVSNEADPALCLTAAGGGTSNGTAVVVRRCNGGADQQWSRT